MMPFTTLTSIVAPLMRDNVDTDTIIPSREIRTTGRTGLADGLFAPWRYRTDRVPDPDFVLNAMPAARILAAGSNFGCGSSREHAVWALAEWGIRAIVAESFAPIFRSNCVRNGLLPIALARASVEAIAGSEVTIDLPEQTLAGYNFEIDAEAKAMLVEGLDAIDLTLKHRAAIAAWTARDREQRPWVYLNPPQQAGEGDHAKHGGGVTRLPPKTNAAVVRARRLRRSLSAPKAMLWTALKQRPRGLKFRKQHPAGPYTLDFYCAAARLCVEVDSEAHERGDRPMRDLTRDRFLAEHGVEVVRLAARDVVRNLEGAVAYISRQATARLPLHHASHGPPPHAQHGEDQP